MLRKQQAAAQTENGGSADDSASEGNGGADGEIYEVVMAMPILGAEPPGMQAVEDAINAVTEPEIGVHLTMYPIFINDLASQQNLMITSGDKLDLAMIFVTGVGTYVNKGALLPLDDLYAQYGQDIEAAEGIAMAGGYFNGNLYAVPSEEKWARSYGFYARTDILEELGMSFDPDTIYTYDDLTELFKAYKDKYGDGYYCISGTNATTDLFQYWDKYDTLGSTLATGVLMGAGLDGIPRLPMCIRRMNTKPMPRKCMSGRRPVIFHRMQRPIRMQVRFRFSPVIIWAVLEELKRICSPICPETAAMI